MVYRRCGRSNQMSNAGEWLVGAVKKNPEGLLLLAAGAALLLRRGMSSPRPANRRPSQYPDAGSQRSGSRASSGSSQSDGGISDTISKAADSAREYASELRDNVGDKAGEYASAVKDYAKDAGHTIADQSERLANRARSTAQGTIERVLEQQPLALAVLGICGRRPGGGIGPGDRYRAPHSWPNRGATFRRRSQCGQAN